MAGKKRLEQGLAGNGAGVFSVLADSGENLGADPFHRFAVEPGLGQGQGKQVEGGVPVFGQGDQAAGEGVAPGRSEEDTSELQSRRNLVCRLLLERKK